MKSCGSGSHFTSTFVDPVTLATLSRRPSTNSSRRAAPSVAKSTGTDVKVDPPHDTVGCTVKLTIFAVPAFGKVVVGDGPVSPDASVLPAPPHPTASKARAPITA